MIAWLRYLAAVLAEKSYLIRPYDPLADRRRWRWQRPAPCGRRLVDEVDPAVLAEITRRARHLETVRQHELDADRYRWGHTDDR